ncbi:MAG TPA: VCBS repeat-containing protein [Kofleriaceae bacterium]|jgi:hypothetical protein
MRALLLVTLAACGQSGEIVVFDGASETAILQTDRYELSVVAAGDVDGDGHGDFFMPSDEATDLYFGLDRPIATLNGGAGVVPLGDVDGDGRADFLLATTDDVTYDTTEWFYPGSAHPFDRPGIAVPGSVVAAAAVDVDGDHRADLVVVTDTSSGTQCGIDVYRGGEGFMLTPESSIAVPAGGTPAMSLQSAGDIDGDGREDLVVAGDCIGDGNIDVYFGGAAITGPPSRMLATGNFPVVARDFNGDGFGDLAVTDGDDTLVYFGPDLDAPMTLAGTLADAGDVDGDGYPDVIVITQTNDVGVYLGGPAIDDVLDIDLAQPSGRPFTSAAYVGGGEVVATYAGWRAE